MRDSVSRKDNVSPGKTACRQKRQCIARRDSVSPGETMLHPHHWLNVWQTFLGTHLFDFLPQRSSLSLMYHQPGPFSMLFHRGGLLSGWFFIRAIFHQGGRPSGWSFFSMIFHEGVFFTKVSFIRAVFRQGGLSLRWSFIKKVFHQGGFSSRRSIIEVVFHQGLHCFILEMKIHFPVRGANPRPMTLAIRWLDESWQRPRWSISYKWPLA